MESDLNDLIFTVRGDIITVGCIGQIRWYGGFSLKQGIET